jgi:hypothetical protein
LSWFKREHNHNFKAQFIEDPLLRTQVDPILALSGSRQIGKKDVQTERGNNSTLKLAIISTTRRHSTLQGSQKMGQADFS